MQEFRCGRFKRMDLTAGGIIGVRGWLGKVGKTCMKWQLNGSENQNALSSMTADQWVAKGECCAASQGVRRCQEARWVWTLSTRSDFLFKQYFRHNVTAGWFRCLKNCRREVFFFFFFFCAHLWPNVNNRKELQNVEKPRNTCCASTRRTNSALAPSPESIRSCSACAVNMSQQISLFFFFPSCWRPVVSGCG